MKGKAENVALVLLQEKVAARLSSDFPAHDIQKFLVRQLLNHSEQSIFILTFKKIKITKLSPHQLFLLLEKKMF